MDENLNNPAETAAEENQSTETVSEQPPKKGKTKKQRVKKEHPIRNQALFKKGGFSVALTAIVLAGIILFNWLVLTLGERFHLEFDMSSEKVSTISEENLDYIKKVDAEVEVTVCAAEDTYESYMNYYGQNLHNAGGASATDYYAQTVKLINKYASYNKKIQVQFVDPQSTEFTKVSATYANDDLAYGDIIVASADGQRHKKIGFEDIYSLSDESGYAAMGYGSYTVSGNNIESRLTSAIVYAVSGETKKAAILTGHSANDATASYAELLESNNYEVETVADSVLTALPADCDVVILAAPTVDFIGSELDILSEYLDNGGKMGKGLLFFGDAFAPAMPNLYAFLAEWGIEIDEGVLFETNDRNYISGDPTTMGVYPAEDTLTDGLTYCIVGANVPIKEGAPTDTLVKVSPIMTTLETVVKAPAGVSAEWNGYTESDKDTYMGVLQAKREDYNDANEKISSYVMAFSSTEYISSQWMEYAQLANKEISLKVTDRAAAVEDNGISFISKTITDESFADSVTASGTTWMRAIFMIALPVLLVVIGIYIFIRRKNA